VNKPRRSRNKRGGKGRGGAPKRDFWGQAEAEIEPPGLIRASVDPTAAVRSLGPAPLPGREVIAEHYFAAVYEKASALAVALAATAGVWDDGSNDPDLLDEFTDEPS
jgi:hypothetical protein